MIAQRIEAFDDEQREALQRIWFLGDVHGQFRHIVRCLGAAPVLPSWLVFLGDLDLEVAAAAGLDAAAVRCLSGRAGGLHPRQP